MAYPTCPGPGPHDDTKVLEVKDYFTAAVIKTYTAPPGAPCLIFTTRRALGVDREPTYPYGCLKCLPLVGDVRGEPVEIV
jgi:hypothetical protein